MNVPLVHKRPPISGKRAIRRIEQTENVREAVGEITPGMELFGLTRGNFSLVSLIEELLAQAGPSHLTVSTWTAANAEISIAYDLMSNGDILSIRFLVDRSFPSRQPEYCQALRETFGPDSIRMTRTHCKFALIRNEKWNLVLRTSMNLNENRRIENFEISDDAALADYLEQIVVEVFDNAGEHWESDFNLLGADDSQVELVL